MPYCPNCKVLATGDTCPKCRMKLVPPMPAQPQKPGITAVPPPPPPPPPPPSPKVQSKVPSPTKPARPAVKPQAQKPIPTPSKPTRPAVKSSIKKTASGPAKSVQSRSRRAPSATTKPSRPVAQKRTQRPAYPSTQHPQPRYRTHTLPPSVQASFAPPKKSRKGAAVLVLSVIAILVIALLAYFFLYEPEKENEVQPDAVLTAKELSEDWSLINGTFEGLNAGDTVVIRDSIKEIEHFGANTTAYGNVSLTIITFMSTEVTIEGFMEGEVPITDIFGFMMFSGNLTKDYQPGDKVDVELTIANYVIEEKTIELPEWYVDILEATQGIMEYEDIEYPDSSKILHTKE